MNSERCNLDDAEEDNANVITENSDLSLPNNSDTLHSSEDNIGITYDSSQHGDFNSEHTIDSDDGDVQVTKNKRNWAELPSLAVGNIYSFLSRPDQCRMSQVCSRWAEDFNSPTLWKTMKFYLPEHDYSSEIYPEVKFARKYGSMFRHVEIICKRVKDDLIEIIWRQLCWFLQAMESSSQLTSIKFINMRKYFRRLNGQPYEELFRIIVRFFNSQEHLKTVVFRKSRFSKEEGSELLKAIFHSDSNTITNLTLRRFVNEFPFTVVSSQCVTNLPEVCPRIAKVQSLELDYTQMFEDIINYLHEKLSTSEYQLDKKKPSMSNLKIFCSGKKQSRFKGILPETWKYLTNAFNHMKVKMDMTIQRHLNRNMEKLLVREIRLQTLSFRFEKSSSRVDISALFIHLQICKYQHHLDFLKVVWLPTIDDFDRSIISFIESCKKLQCFNICAKCDQSIFENFLLDVKQIIANRTRTNEISHNWVIYNPENDAENNS